MGICENIQRLCKNKGLPISHLEKELALANGSIRRWNESSPATDKLQKVAEYFKVSTDHLLYGFERALFNALINLVRDGRTFEVFSLETDADLQELASLCTSTAVERPSLDTLERIAANNPYSVITRDEILKAGGYYPNEIPETPDTNIIKYVPVKNQKYTTLSPKEERDIARDLEKILANLENDNGMSFYDGEPMDGMDEEDRELLRISLLTSMQIAKQMAKKKFTPKKYRKE